jgi:hypothetical protein
MVRACLPCTMLGSGPAGRQGWPIGHEEFIWNLDFGIWGFKRYALCSLRFIPLHKSLDAFLHFHLGLVFQ